VPEIQGVRARARGAEERLDSVARKLGVPIDEFLSREDEQTAHPESQAKVEGGEKEVGPLVGKIAQLERERDEALKGEAVALEAMEIGLQASKPRAVVRMLKQSARFEGGRVIFEEGGQVMSLKEILPSEFLRSRTTGGSGGQAPRPFEPTMKTNSIPPPVMSQKAYEQMTEAQKRDLAEQLGVGRKG
jgi:hypothetical protein